MPSFLVERRSVQGQRAREGVGAPGDRGNIHGSRLSAGTGNTRQVRWCYVGLLTLAIRLCMIRPNTGILRAMDTPARRTLLVIDDDAQTRELFRTTLETAGYRVLTADSGQAGLRLLQHQAVDLILVDIFMPAMDGLELIRRLRALPSIRNIIAMSGGMGEWDYLDIAKRLGANQALRKPCPPHAILDAVRAELKADENA